MKSYLKKENFLVDIFLFGSALRSKEEPRDIDIILLFRDKDYKKIEDISYAITKIGKKLHLNLHVESMVIDDIYREKIYSTILHEGFSIKNGKFIAEMLGFVSYTLITYLLKDKTASEKVKFSYALYGREKGTGFLSSIGGEEIGKGAIIVPIQKEELAKEFFDQWKVSIKTQRIIIIR